jgi:hypothetical protein
MLGRRPLVQRDAELFCGRGLLEHHHYRVRQALRQTHTHVKILSTHQTMRFSPRPDGRRVDRSLGPGKKGGGVSHDRCHRCALGSEMVAMPEGTYFRLIIEIMADPPGYFCELHSSRIRR